MAKRKPVTQAEIDREIANPLAKLVTKRGITKQKLIDERIAGLKAIKETEYRAKNGKMVVGRRETDAHTREACRKFLESVLGIAQTDIKVGGDPENPIRTKLEIVFVRGSKDKG